MKQKKNLGQLQTKIDVYISHELASTELPIDNFIERIRSEVEVVKTMHPTAGNFTIEFGYEHGYYDDIENVCWIRFVRMETPKELKLRLDQEAVEANYAAKAKIAKDEHERKEYERLKKKFEAKELAKAVERDRKDDDRFERDDDRLRKKIENAFEKEAFRLERESLIKE
jgi:hypothetical protein